MNKVPAAKGQRMAEVLEELVAAAERCGIEVRREKLLREIGYRARSGSCRVKEKNLVILDRDQAPAEQLEVLAEALRERDLETLYLSPAARRMVENQPI
jgi:hypothetical protein